MATSTLKPPPPPPAAIEEQSPNQPTFMQKWLEQEKAKLPSAQKQNAEQRRQKLNAYFDKECLFPSYIPEEAMPDTEPLLALIHDFDIDTDGEKSDVQHTSSHRTPLDDIRKITSLCASYKTKALENRNEFQYKQAVKMLEKEKATKNQSTDETSDLPSKPPHHPEYTPIPLSHNYLMANIHSANYNLCLANGICPTQTRRLLTCWQSLDPRWVKMMKEQGLESYICLEEREAVERCVGVGVQRVMKNILG